MEDIKGFKLPQRNRKVSENNQKSKPHAVGGLDSHPTPAKSGNVCKAPNTHDKELQETFQDLKKQVEMSNSAPIITPASLQGPFNGIDNKEKIRDVKVDVDSISSSHGRREVELDTRNNEGAIVKLRKDILVLPMMGFSITVFFSLMTFHNPTDINLGMRIFILLLPISFLVYFIGYLLPNKYSEKSDLIKLVGHEIFSMGMYGLMASYLWYYNMAFIPILCAILTTVLLVMVYFEKL